MVTIAKQTTDHGERVLASYMQLLLKGVYYAHIDPLVLHHLTGGVSQLWVGL